MSGWERTARRAGRRLEESVYQDVGAICWGVGDVAGGGRPVAVGRVH